ncbi:MAG: hypothetical protein LBG68_02210, partial [Coriobacteriales bacterium]|nr:hypothetical protein [Coriobacteriales bacterium]
MSRQIRIDIPADVQVILDALQNAGYPAYLVGGSVRDNLRQHLGKSSVALIEDWDIASAAQPEELAQVFSTYRVIATGEAFGTMTVLTDKRPVQITTFRADGT